MAEHFLYGAEIRPSGKQMRGKRVSKSMRRNRLGNARPDNQPLDSLPQTNP